MFLPEDGHSFGLELWNNWTGCVEIEEQHLKITFYAGVCCRCNRIERKCALHDGLMMFCWTMRVNDHFPILDSDGWPIDSVFFFYFFLLFFFLVFVYWLQDNDRKRLSVMFRHWVVTFGSSVTGLRWLKFFFFFFFNIVHFFISNSVGALESITSGFLRRLLRQNGFN